LSEYADYQWGDGETDAHSYIYPVLRSLLTEHKGKLIIDVGCGNGVIACKLIAEGFDVYGIDASASGISIARRAHADRFFIHDTSSEYLPEVLADKKFDVVVSTEVIEHLYAPRRYIELIRTLLRPGGMLILSTPYHGYLKNLALALTNKLDSHFTALWDGGHIKFWSIKTISVLLGEFDFKVVLFKGCGRIPFLWKSMFVSAKLSP